MALEVPIHDHEAIAFEAKTNLPVAALPFRSLGWGKALNSQGTASMVIPLSEDVTLDAPTGPGASATELLEPGDLPLEAFEEGATIVYLTRDGTPFHGVFIWTTEIDSGGESITLTGKDWTSYLHRIRIDRDLRFLKTDERLIATGLVNFAIGKTGAAPGLEVPALSGSAKARDREYKGQERKPVGEALEQLAAVDEGFQFRYSYEYAAPDTDSPVEGMRSFLDIEDDPRGRLVDNAELELHRNAEVVRWTRDATELVNYAEAWSTAQGDNGILQSALSIAGQARYPLLEHVETFTDVTERGTLDGKARFAIARNERPMERIVVAIGYDPDLPLGSFDVGDRINVVGRHGRLRISGEWKVVELGGNVDAQGAETIGATLVPAYAFSPANIGF